MTMSLFVVAERTLKKDAKQQALIRLAPNTVEAILDGRQPASLQLADLLRPFPVTWTDQMEAFFGHPGVQRPRA